MLLAPYRILPLVVTVVILAGCNMLKSKPVSAAEQNTTPASVTSPVKETPNTDSSSQPASTTVTTSGSSSAETTSATGRDSAQDSAVKNNARNTLRGKGSSRAGQTSAEDTTELRSSGNTIYFALDDYSLTTDDQAVLQQLAARLKKDNTLKAELHGHTDERGTTNYNLALGEKRGQAVQTYLRTSGITANRLEVISYGETQPANAGHNAAAWAENRRVEVVIQP